ncbi:hypothetical protein NitYY0826_C1888 [Nitratiruptor sp. YY08-26]|nr:hypothetical protein NitYY0813_C1886 [Nitratiruptor sp. YY08-13]BCD66935.1 hypothetical protein NitYY0826_C1888 [Nitratiruptor sp. YY08-26]
MKRYEAMFKLFNLLVIIILFSGCMENTQKLDKKRMSY